MDALQATLQVVDRGGSRDRARLLGRTFLARLEPKAVDELITEAALQRILGRPIPSPTFTPCPGPWERHVAETAAIAWLLWASGKGPQACEVVHLLRSRQKEKETFSGQGGALHLLTLSFWTEATTHLVGGDPIGARRFFKRALSMGSQFGTDSHPMISWAYVASFFV
jgi:hypothetical protein